MAELQQVPGPPKECCQDPANRGPLEPLSDDLSVSTCKCGAKHYELTVDPGVLGVMGTDL